MRTPSRGRRLPIVSPPGSELGPGHSRRDLLRYLGALTATLAVPFGAEGCSSPPPVQTGFFTNAERTALTALANAVIPPDDTPGGADLGAVPYIERLLTAFDKADANNPAAIYAGGPFSGRAPFADPNGAASQNFPPNSFATYLPLNRVMDAAWRLRLFGSTALPTGAPNEALLGAVTGMRDEMKTGLAAAIAGAPAPLDTLNEDDLIAYFQTLQVGFRQLVIDLVSQAAFCAPEYAGNVGLAGWKMVHFEGDQQPFGYSVWSTATNAYVERPDAPMTTPDASDPEPLSPDIVTFIDQLIQVFPQSKKFS